MTHPSVTADVVRPCRGTPSGTRPARPPAAGFMGSVNVRTESGWLEISRMVRHRLPVRVACLDPGTGRIVCRPVVDWSCRCGDPADLVAPGTFARGGGERCSRGAHRAIRVARGQAFLGPGGAVPAGALRPGDAVWTVGTRLEPWQEQLVLGALLGDGYAAGRAAGRYGGLAVYHGHARRGYLDWKFARHRNVGAKPPSEQRLMPGGFARKPTARFTTRAHPDISGLAGAFYGTGVKRPPAGVVARAGWLGLGVWFGVDGGCVFSEAAGRIVAFRIHTNAFAVEEVDRLAEELLAFTGLPWRRYLQNGKYPILTLGNGDGSAAFPGTGHLARWSEAIRPYLPPAMAYKLRVESCGWAWDGLEPPGGDWPEPAAIRSSAACRPAPHEDCLLFHLEVDGASTFVANGVVVGDLSAVGIPAGDAAIRDSGGVPAAE